MSLLVRKAHRNWKTFLGMLSRVRFLFRYHAVDLPKGTWGHWHADRGFTLLLLRLSPCWCSEGKSKRSNQWLWCPRSFLLQDFLCVLGLLLGTQVVANMIPPLHDWVLRCHKFGYLSFMNLQFLKKGPGKTVESHKEMLLRSSALPSFSGDRLGVKTNGSLVVNERRQELQPWPSERMMAYQKLVPSSNHLFQTSMFGYCTCQRLHHTGHSALNYLLACRLLCFYPLWCGCRISKAPHWYADYRFLVGAVSVVHGSVEPCP